MRHKSEATMGKIIKETERFYFTYRRSPSITELANAVGCARSTAHGYLREMDAKEMLSYDGESITTPLMRKTDMNAVLSPILGSVICGEPQMEEENFEEIVALPTAVFGNGDFFLLHAKGESMIGAGIDPGDLVVVRKQETAEDGDIVVVLVNNENTLKRYYRDEAHRCIRLHPENPNMKDIYVRNCRIQGVASHVIKRLREVQK